jgi:hypothetical protein
VTRFYVYDSGDGDELGCIEVEDNAPDELILEHLVNVGFLDQPAERYEIDHAYPFSELEEHTVLDDDGEPVAVLDSRPPGSWEDDDEEEDEAEQLNSEDVL